MIGTNAAEYLEIGQDGGFRAAVNPLGAELSRLRDGNGNDLLWNGDPAVWSGRAPVLFPIIGELAGHAYRWQGQSYPMGRHGFARRRTWETIAHGADQLALRLAADDETRAIYPFAFVLDLEFVVGAGDLAMTARVMNAGDGVMPFSFGFHPALRWPFASGAPRDAHFVLFDREEPAPIARLDAEGLIACREPSPVGDRILPLADGLFEADAMVFDGLNSRAVEFGAPGEARLRCEFPAFPDLGIWTKPGAGYLCIEPWLGMADPAGFTGDLAAKPGIHLLQPGRLWEGTMTIRLKEHEA